MAGAPTQQSHGERGEDAILQTCHDGSVHGVTQAMERAGRGGVLLLGQWARAMAGDMTPFADEGRIKPSGDLCEAGDGGITDGMVGIWRC